MCIPERSEMDLLMIKWCIYLCHLSSKAYDTLRQSGVVYLPSRRTLRDYTHYIPAQSGSVTQSKIHPLATGFSSAVYNMLFQSVNIPSCAERERWVILLMDEMHIRENLVFDKHTGLYDMLYNGICLYTRLCILQRLSLVSLTWEISTITWQPMRNA